MLFDAKEFEHFFTAQNLKRGLSLFEKGEVNMLASPAGGSWEFLIRQEYRVNICKRGDKILSYTCSCRNKKLCEHLSAALFHFQKETLGIAVKRLQKARVLPGAKTPNTNFRESLKKIPQGKLLDFMDHYAFTNEIFRETAKFYFSDGAGDKNLEYFQFRIRALVNHSREKLSQMELDGIYRAILELFDKVRPSESDPEIFYYLHLAVFSVLPEILDRRITGDEEQLLSLFFKSRQALSVYFGEKLSSAQRKLWLRVCLQWKITRRIGLDGLLFLVPRAIRGIQDKNEFNALKAVIQKCKAERQYSGQLNKLLILQLQLAMKGARLFKRTLPSRIARSSVESIIARAELDFCAQKILPVFGFLEKEYGKIKGDHPAQTLAFLDYVVARAAEYQQTALEIKYLKESMLQSIYIPTLQLRRLLHILPAGSRLRQINEFVKELKNTPAPFLEEKIWAILLGTGKIKDLTVEVEKFPGKFTLLHRLMFQSLPDYQREAFPLYASQLLQALENKKERHEREYLMTLTVRYVERLPEEEAASLVREILDRVREGDAFYVRGLERFGHHEKKALKGC